MNNDKKFSTRALVVTVLITAVISSLIGGLFDSYFDRPKPSISVLSVGFEAPIRAESIRLSDENSRISKRATWIESFERFEPFSRVVELEEATRRYIQEANELVKSLEGWKTKYIGRPNHTYSAEEILSAAAILDHPFLSSSFGGNVFTTNLQAGKIGSVTHSLEDIGQIQVVVDFEDVPARESFAFSLSYKIQFIPYKDASVKRKEVMKLFANSFGRGITQNILEFTNHNISQNRKDILEAQQLQGSLRSALLPNSAIAISVLLHNDGKSPITFTPYFGLKIAHQDYNGNTLILVARQTQVSEEENPFALTSGGFSISLDSQQEGKRVEVEPFLPDTLGTTYISIPGGQTVRLKLQGDKPLGSMAEGLVQLHATKLLKAVVVGLTSEGEAVTSKPAAFSLSVDADVKARLESSKG